MKLKHISFPSIEQFRNVIYNVNRSASYGGYNEETKEPIILSAYTLPTLKFRGTVKLHGTNAGIVLSNEGDVSFQSRENILSLMHDNAGFFLYGSNLPKEFFDTFRNRFIKDNTVAVAIYGEWCGGNIQKGVGISGLPKMFVLFGVKTYTSLERDEQGKMSDGEWVNYKLWEDIEFPEQKVYNINKFPTYEIEIDFAHPQLSQNKLVELTIAVEQECPVAKHFGNTGIGEGIVWQCITEGYNNSGYWMKVKGEKHQSSKTKTLAPVDIEEIRSINEFAKNVTTESRLNQGLEKLKETHKEVDRKLTGEYLKWITSDVLKEEGDTIVQNNLDSKKVLAEVSTIARQWFFTQIDKV